MCGEHGHSIDYDAIRERMDEMTRARFDASMGRFNEMVKDGSIFVRKPTPIRIEDIAYG